MYSPRMLVEGRLPAKAREAISSAETAKRMDFILCTPVLTIILAPPSWGGPPAALKRLIALPRRIALVIVDQLPIRSHTLLRLMTPEQPVARMRHGRIPFRLDVHAFPAEVVAAVVVEASQRGALA